MDQVGRYQILEELGRGSHGVVYKALDPAIGRTIAVKAIAIGEIYAVDRERVRETMLGEARLAGTLSHPNIVTVYDVVDSDNAVYIVMEFVDGESLEYAIHCVTEGHPGVLTRAGFISIFRQVAQALDYAHRKGVVHRDVKPANIVITGQRMDQTGQLLAKIADFGVAKFSSHETTQQLDGQPALVGTPNYMSPEQVEGLSLSGASDQFSLAVVAYEILAGKKAFVADSLEGLLYRIRYDHEEPVNEANTALSPTVAKVMQRALAKDPTERFHSCSEFAGALEFALGDSPQWTPGGLGVAELAAAKSAVPYAEQEFAPQAEPSGWGRRLALMLALCLAAAMALVLIVRMNSGSAIPTQVLDTKNAPVAAPPSIDELKEDSRIAAPSSDLTLPRIAKSPNALARPEVENPVVTLPKKQIPVRLVKPVVTSGEVQLSSDPPGANIEVDGINTCVAPCSFTLGVGRHTLAARLSGFEVARKIFSVPQDLSVFVSLVKSIGVLQVTSEPAGATVEVDGQLFGQTPITLRLLSGIHRVSVSNGSRRQDETVQINGDEVRTRRFVF